MTMTDPTAYLMLLTSITIWQMDRLSAIIFLAIVAFAVHKAENTK